MRSQLATGILISTVLAVSGCVSQEPVRTASLCPPGLTYSCSSKVGKIQKCTCATRQDLKSILDPANNN